MTGDKWTHHGVVQRSDWTELKVWRPGFFLVADAFLTLTGLGLLCIELRITQSRAIACYAIKSNRVGCSPAMESLPAELKEQVAFHVRSVGALISLSHVSRCWRSIATRAVGLLLSSLPQRAVLGRLTEQDVLFFSRNTHRKQRRALVLLENTDARAVLEAHAVSLTCSVQMQIASWCLTKESGCFPCCVQGCFSGRAGNSRRALVALKVVPSPADEGQWPHTTVILAPLDSSSIWAALFRVVPALCTSPLGYDRHGVPASRRSAYFRLLETGMYSSGALCHCTRGMLCLRCSCTRREWFSCVGIFDGEAAHVTDAVGTLLLCCDERKQWLCCWECEQLLCAPYYEQCCEMFPYISWTL